MAVQFRRRQGRSKSCGKADVCLGRRSFDILVGRFSRYATFSRRKVRPHFSLTKFPETCNSFVALARQEQHGPLLGCSMGERLDLLRTFYRRHVPKPLCKEPSSYKDLRLEWLA
jgi:hypothetical protein